MSEYIKKLENILEGVENYRFNDASCAEWEELTTHVLKGAIAREKANQEADELASSVWNKLGNLSEPKLNENQEIVLEYLKKEYFDSYVKSVLSNLYFYVNLTAVADLENEEIKSMVDAYEKLEDIEFAQVLQAFATWALDQC